MQDRLLWLHDEMETQDKFAELVRLRLVELGMTANQLELAAGLPKNFVGAVVTKESHRREPRISKVEALCALLDISFTFGEANPATSNPNHGEFEYLTKWGPEPVLDDIAFRHAWLKRLGIGAGNALTFTVPDSAMAPTLAKQEVVLIDRGRAEVTPRSIYLFTDPNQVAMVRRLEWLGDTLVASADNPALASTAFTGDDKKAIRIIGEAVWSARTLR